MLRRQCRGSYKPKYKKVGVLPIRIVKSSVGPPSERRPIFLYLSFLHFSVYYPYRRQYTNLFIFRFVSLHCLCSILYVYLTKRTNPTNSPIYCECRLHWTALFENAKHVNFIRYEVQGISKRRKKTTLNTIKQGDCKIYRYQNRASRETSMHACMQVGG